ncbi:MAG: hypothetical protein HC848_04710 [Limnobacter sp.]|nr:hypothetical protein [Limnobacter sp.]
MAGEHTTFLRWVLAVLLAALATGWGPSTHALQLQLSRLLASGKQTIQWHAGFNPASKRPEAFGS